MDKDPLCQWRFRVALILGCFEVEGAVGPFCFLTETSFAYTHGVLLARFMSREQILWLSGF